MKVSGISARTPLRVWRDYLSHSLDETLECRTHIICAPGKRDLGEGTLLAQLSIGDPLAANMSKRGGNQRHAQPSRYQAHDRLHLHRLLLYPWTEACLAAKAHHVVVQPRCYVSRDHDKGGVS